jgi:signal peptidase I
MPPRRPGSVDADQPTVVGGRPDPSGHLDDASADSGSFADPSGSEAPGRHRRRAGTSSDERPAADYREQAEADGGKARTGRRRRSTFWKELPLLVVVALLLTFLIQTFLAKVYVIPSGSMETTLHGCTGCNNDRVLVDKITYRFTDPAPGDVVVFRGPDSWNSEIDVPEPTSTIGRGLQEFGSLIGLAPPDEKDFVKRVIAVGGQTVSCCDSRNRVMVDGEPLDEPYIYYLPEAGPARQSPFGPVTVPEGQLWMMGDSRNNSADSREPDHGPVPVTNVIGKARMIVLPFSRFSWIDAVDPHSTAVGMGGPPAGAPAALGLIGTLPFALLRRRRWLREQESPDFLPSLRRP